MAAPADRPSWGTPATTGGAVSVRTVDGETTTGRVVFELLSDAVSFGRAELLLRAADVCRLQWRVDASAPARVVVTALRQVVRTAFGDLGAHRVEVHTHEGSPDGGIALRVGLRREGVLRSSLATADGDRVDVAVYAGVATDVGPESPGGFTSMLDSILPKKRLIAHVVITDPHGRILLCETTFKSDWELPGGVVEPGEPPTLAAFREVQEELGVDLPIGRLLVVDWLPPYLGWSDAMELLYDGGVQDPAYADGLRLGVTEIRSVAWCTVDEAVARVSALNARRLPLLLPTLPAATLHLQDGVPV